MPESKTIKSQIDHGLIHIFHIKEFSKNLNKYGHYVRVSNGKIKEHDEEGCSECRKGDFKIKRK